MVSSFTDCPYLTSGGLFRLGLLIHFHMRLSLIGSLLYDMIKVLGLSLTLGTVISPVSSGDVVVRDSDLGVMSYIN